MIALELTEGQRSAIDAPFEECFALLGASGTGKTTALTERAARARALSPDCMPLTIDAPADLEAYAVDLLAAGDVAATLVDDVEAQLAFARDAAPLLKLQWDEFSANQLDPEVPGLRSPERFLESAFRLIRRLRDAAVAPTQFLSRALTAATEFYANPPNLAAPALLAATKATYHDSLDVTPNELNRQYRREVDLAKILAKLYARYVETVTATGSMTGRDAAIAAAQLLRANPALASDARKRHHYAFVDDAQELTDAHLQLLAAIFGDDLSGVTLCGDPASAISPLRMSRPEATFARAQSRVTLRERHRRPSREVERASSSSAEADLIAERIAGWLEQGVVPNRIAVLFRSVANVEIYEKALIDRGIPTAIGGDFNVFADRRALDAIALLWNVYDPFRHDWLLRTLANPAFGLSDASLAILCAEPPDPQRPLFTFDDEPAPTTKTSRWNPKRDVRLGWNVLRGDQDEALQPDAAARVQRFRRLREGWLATMHEAPFEEFVRTVWHEGLAREGTPSSARARAQQSILRMLLDRLNQFVSEHGAATVGDVLAYAEERMEIDGIVVTADDTGVQMLSVEAARGREFDHVVIGDVRAGAFPRWYSPENFLFSPRLGMIPRENVGDAHASRTAKFSFYMAGAKAAKRYYLRERRAFEYALSRARKSVLVTASGAPTRGVTAPELLEELR